MNIKVINQVKQLLSSNDGHGFDHIMRVRDLALKFADREDSVDKNIIELAALLHDVDDYKLFGNGYAEKLINANKIMDNALIDKTTKDRVLDIIKSIGYNKYLSGIRPKSLEGMIVSDADMCEAIGAQGILRTYAYNMHKGNNFFDKDMLPQNPNKSSNEYKTSSKTHSVQHFFDKLLIIPNILLTKPGREEGRKRQKIMISFLKELFREENSEIWNAHLEKFLEENR